MSAFNEGDKDVIDLCLKAMNGIISKSKLGLSKGDSDRKSAEMMLRVRREGDELEKYDTKKLEEMLKRVREVEDGEEV